MKSNTALLIVNAWNAMYRPIQAYIDYSKTRWLANVEEYFLFISGLGDVVGLLGSH